MFPIYASQSLSGHGLDCIGCEDRDNSFLTCTNHSRHQFPISSDSIFWKEHFLQLLLSFVLTLPTFIRFLEWCLFLLHFHFFYQKIPIWITFFDAQALSLFFDLLFTKCWIRAPSELPVTCCPLTQLILQLPPLCNHLHTPSPIRRSPAALLPILFFLFFLC